jgi:hypothetical protein
LSTRRWKIGWRVDFMWLGGAFNSNIKMHFLISKQIEKEQKKELSPQNCSCLSDNVIHGLNVFFLNCFDIVLEIYELFYGGQTYANNFSIYNLKKLLDFIL